MCTQVKVIVIEEQALRKILEAKMYGEFIPAMKAEVARFLEEEYDPQRQVQIQLEQMFQSPVILDMGTLRIAKPSKDLVESVMSLFHTHEHHSH